jgi:ribosome-associated toxin RatA of RatAB toxin-antitoxin module
MVTWQIADNKFDFSVTHSLAASKEVVYRVLADMEAYPEFVNDLVSVSREGNLYKFVARVAILTVSATLAVTEMPGQAIAFELVDGPVDVLTGSWLIEPGRTPDQTRVTLTLHVETQARGEWLLRMTGKFVQNKADKLIAAFSNRVIELQRSGVAPAPKPKAGGFIAWFKNLWVRFSGQPAQSTASPTPVEQPAAKLPLFRDEHLAETLEALASTMIPADDFDAGVQGLGFASVAEMRSRYEAGRAELYLTALQAVDQMAQTIFNKPNFVELLPAERTALLDSIRQNQANDKVWGGVKPSAFFSALREDVTFLYCTHPDTWERIGFPGPSFDSKGYADADQPQAFTRRVEAKF